MRPRDPANPVGEETEAAELQAKLALADEATALARQNTKLLDLEALELDRKCNLL